MVANLNVIGRGDCLLRDYQDEPVGSLGEVFEDSDKVKLIPRSEWKDIFATKVSLETLVSKIKNQKSESSCASNAATQCYEIVARKTAGKKAWIETSAIHLYKRVGRTKMGGSTIGGNIRELAGRGVLPTTPYKDRFEHTMPEVGWHLRMPPGWEETAKLFKAHEWLDIRSIEGFISALAMDFPVCYGRAGHAICGVHWQDGRIRYANSWGNWGDKGFGWDTERFISGAIRSYGAWALTSIETNPQILAA